MASRLVAEIVRDFEGSLSALMVRPFDDGRFTVRLNGKPIFQKQEAGRFPSYDQDIKPQLQAAA